MNERRYQHKIKTVKTAMFSLTLAKLDAQLLDHVNQETQGGWELVTIASQGYHHRLILRKPV